MKAGLRVRWAVAICVVAAAWSFTVGAQAPCRDEGIAHVTVARPLPAQGARTVGLALGSGSMHGVAHIGVIQALEEQGIRVDVVTGTSVGALVGALWASGLRGPELADVARRVEWTDLADWTLSSRGLMQNEPLGRALGKYLRPAAIERWPRRFGAVATRLRDGQRVLLTRGDGALAVRASSAIPVMFKPVEVEGEALLDGSLVEPVPVAAARALGADYVIAVDVAYRPSEGPVGGMPSIAFQSFHILVNALAAPQLAQADVAIRLDVHRRFEACGPESLVAAGRAAVQQWLREARQ